MKEFIEKLIEKLIRDKRIGRKTFEAIIEDIKEVSEEYKMSEMPTDWIPCSERLPDEYEDIYISGELIDSYDGQSYKSVFGETEQKDCFYGYYHNGEFFGYTEEGVFWRIDAIAWQPLPAPYKKGCETEE